MSDNPLENKPKILIVEDNKVNLKVATRVLLNLGYAPIPVENGFDALEKLQEETIEIVMIDLSMPVICGLETIKLIRKLEAPKKDVAIFVVSAAISSSAKAELKLYDVNVFLEKPYHIQDLKNLFLNYFKQQTPVPDNSVPVVKADVEVINKKLIAELLTTFSYSSFVRFLNKVQVQVGEVVPIIRSAAEKNDHETIRKNAHSLKGSVGQLGMSAAQNIALTLEKNSHTLESTVVYELLDSLVKHHDEAQVSIREFLKQYQ